MARYRLSTFVAKSSQRLASYFNVIERNGLAVCSLRFFVALAREEDDVTRRRLPDGESDGFATIGFGDISGTGLLKTGFL